jgi:hypothetical protein
VRRFKGIFCDDISEFESDMPSQAVRSPASLPAGSPKSARTRPMRSAAYTQYPLRGSGQQRPTLNSSANQRMGANSAARGNSRYPSDHASALRDQPPRGRRRRAPTYCWSSCDRCDRHRPEKRDHRVEPRHLHHRATIAEAVVPTSSISTRGHEIHGGHDDSKRCNHLCPDCDHTHK